MEWTRKVERTAGSSLSSLNYFYSLSDPFIYYLDFISFLFGTFFFLSKYFLLLLEFFGRRVVYLYSRFLSC